MHITECYSGGIATAIRSYIDASLQHDHYLCATLRSGYDISSGLDCHRLREILILPRKVSSLLRAYRFYRKIQPEVVHLHSSYAGVLGRLIPIFPRHKVVFTPHAFSFVRNDPLILLKFYICLERFLMKRTRYIAACGAYEQYLAKEKLGFNDVIVIPNVAPQYLERRKLLDADGQICIGMVGRLSRQKGVGYFLDVVEQIKDVGQFIWIGGGNQSAKKLLEKHGVEVTGWLNETETLSRMEELDIYLHSAEWEGFPLSVLEAAKLQIPMVLREIPMFTYEGLDTVRTSTDAAKRIKEFASRNLTAIQSCRNNTRKINQEHSPQKLAQNIMELYSKFEIK